MLKCFVFLIILDKIANVHVVIISDGHAQMNIDCKKYLRSLFCKTRYDEEAFDELYASLDRYVKEKAEADEDERINTPIQERKKMPTPLTYVIQRVDNRCNRTFPIKVLGAKDNIERRLTLTLVLKSLNRRKHNSQEWMFSCGQSLRADYIFLTDCGTLFEKGCILRLGLCTLGFLFFKSDS